MDDNETLRKPDGVSEQVASTDVRDRLTELINRARYAGERFILTRNGEPVAVIIGAQELELLPPSVTRSLSA